MNSYTVLMTACIDPTAGWVPLHRKNPATRLRDYCEGMRFWLELNDPRITGLVFIDNSAHPLNTLRELAASTNPWSRQVEFLSIDDNHYPPDVHYGYAELGMIDAALTSSRLLCATSHFIKATGRLTFPDVGRLLDRIPTSCVFAVDSRNTTLLTRHPQMFIATQLMVFAPDFYKEHLLGCKVELKKPLTHVEELVFRKLMPFKSRRGAILRWPVNVAPKGIAAHWDKNYSSPRQTLVNAVRAACRILLPNWWI